MCGGGGGERAEDFNFNKRFLTRQVKRTIPQSIVKTRGP